ncbi:MAG: c-type cytochrome [Planctomycetes bacterium]|nr:c-type cytochrome [Planctomycetota bacterium]
MSLATRGHTFDGIEEFDNRLPNWWLWSFYLACIFSVGYWIHFHTLGTGHLPQAAFLAEQQEIAARLEAELAKNPVTDESLLKLSKEGGVVAEGEKAFMAEGVSCKFCHKPDGSGLTGPNLTDKFWVYGGKPLDIYTTIMEGRPNGMPPWKQNGSMWAQRVTAYVLAKVKHTNVAGGLPPQGKEEQ